MVKYKICNYICGLSVLIVSYGSPKPKVETYNSKLYNAEILSVILF